MRYLPQDGRSLLVHRWIEHGLVAEEIEEARDRVAEVSRTITQHLSETREVVGIKRGVSQLHDFGVILAYEVARYLAQRGDGLIRNDQHQWLAIEKGAFVPVWQG